MIVKQASGQVPAISARGEVDRWAEHPAGAFEAGMLEDKPAGGQM